MSRRSLGLTSFAYAEPVRTTSYPVGFGESPHPYPAFAGLARSLEGRDPSF
jgi:hypothetical protein